MDIFSRWDFMARTWPHHLSIVVFDLKCWNADKQRPQSFDVEIACDNKHYSGTQWSVYRNAFEFEKSPEKGDFACEIENRALKRAQVQNRE